MSGTITTMSKLSERGFQGIGDVRLAIAERRIRCDANNSLAWLNAMLRASYARSAVGSAYQHQRGRTFGPAIPVANTTYAENPRADALSNSANSLASGGHGLGIQ